MKYQSGIEVREGDIVKILYEGTFIDGVVRKVLLPNTEDARTWFASDGGVLIEGGGLGLSVTKSLEDDEDVIFVQRAENSTPI